MLPLLGTKNLAEAELWDFTRTSDPINGVVDTYFKARDVRLQVVNAAAGVMSVFTKEELKFNGQLRNLRDHKGDPIYGSLDTIAYIGPGEPVVDVYGSRIGFRYSITRGSE